MIEAEGQVEPPSSLPQNLESQMAVDSLVSPDSRNNNRPNHQQPCLISPEKENLKSISEPELSDTEEEEGRLLVVDESMGLDAQNFQGRILYSADTAYIIEGDAHVHEEVNLEPEPKQLPLKNAFRVRSQSSDRNISPPKTVIQRFRVVSVKDEQVSMSPETKENSIESPILICFLCKLSFSQAQTFESHVRNEHQLTLNTEEHGNLNAPGSSAILQPGPVFSFLCPVVEKEKLHASPMDMSAEELARNLMLASELSASRLLQQVSKNALVMGYTTGCGLHAEPKADCINCDLLMLKQQQPVVTQSQQMQYGSASTARNSCKTLKCPKCNWHYKYQETLEIHMKEKHPDNEVTCVYCVHNRPHPKLSRGETYNCGYKPYRCEICNYSTTTKGNLSIHMQSDKHLNNVQELQKGNKMIDPATFIHAESPSLRVTSPDSKSGSKSPGATSSGFRCDVCSYETSVARNLRIHMTSEKHAQNMLLLQRKLAGGLREPVVGQQEMNPFASFPTLGLEAISMQQLTMDENAPLRLYQCCVCFQFGCDNVDQLVAHVELDRSQPGPADVSVLAGNYYCNLCQYKTHLKANFQLHTKTDKHLQRLQLVNHIREGGLQNEWRLRYVNVNNPVHLRCNACNEFFTSWHKLQLHALSGQHQISETAFDKLRCISPSVDNSMVCGVCDFEAERRNQMLAHMQTSTHSQALTQALQTGVGGKTVDFLEISNWDERETRKTVPEVEGPVDGVDPEVDMTEAVHCCTWCNFICKSTMELCAHVHTGHGDFSTKANDFSANSLNLSMLCPLCQSDCGDSEKLEYHLSQDHKVSEEGVKRLLLSLLPSQNSPTPASVAADSTTPNSNDPEPSSPIDQIEEKSNFSCPVCSVPFINCNELYVHQEDSGHLELTQTPRGPGYLCWHKGCNQYFQTTAAVQVHFKEIHAKKTQSAGCVSDRHVYRYRCNQCSLAFRTEEKLTAHSVYHVMRASTRCAICGKSFRSIPALKKHVESAHIDNKSPATSPESGNEEQNAPNDKSSPDEIDECDTEEDHLNGQDMAECGYSDSSRKFKCHRCKVAFTKQHYLVTHNKTLLHKKGEKVNFSLDKFFDPNRPFKCDVCKESFTQKTILLVHFNSVSHLHKAKKLLEQQGSNISPEMLASLNKVQPITNSTPQTSKASPVPESKPKVNNKPYKCNICRHSYGQPSTLDIHLKSVAHQSRANRLQDLVMMGEVDLSVPLIEQPDMLMPISSANQPTKQLISEMLSKKTPQTPALVDSQQSAAALMASMMAPFLAQAFPPNPSAKMYICDHCTSIFATEDALQMHQKNTCNKMKERSHTGTPDETDDIETSGMGHCSRNPTKTVNCRSGHRIRKMLENYGFDVVMQYNETVLQRKRKAHNMEETERKEVKIEPEKEVTVNNLPEIGLCSCDQCGKQFSSIWVLKAHIEQVHKESVPIDVIEKLSEEFKEVYEKKNEENSTPVSTAVTTTASVPVSEPAKKPITSTAPSTKQKKTEPTESTKYPITSQSQMMFPGAALSAMMGMPGMNMLQTGFANPFMFPNPFMPMMLPTSLSDPTAALNMAVASGFPDITKSTNATNTTPSISSGMEQSPKRARTRITDDQLKVLREYFDINNSPSEEQIKEMAQKSNLPLKVIKHWFRNTLFKERQRNKDSPYNFSIPPTLGVDLDTYDRTGEARVISLYPELAETQENSDNHDSKTEEKVEPEKKKEEIQNLKLEVKEEEPEIDVGVHDEQVDLDEGDISPCPMSISVPPESQVSSQMLSPQETLRRLSVPPQIPMLPSTTNPFSMLMAAQHSSSLSSLPTHSTSSTDAMTSLIASAMTPGSAGINYGQGRRANRTRFTDFQLKSLQDFFEKQAYPKDDDLEFLSKKLQLSPRVIVVWFQNARQKARKIYENQPNAESGERFVKTPGCNFQCKRCSLVFQRYYELIQHQQKQCYKDEVIPSLKETMEVSNHFNGGSTDDRCDLCDIDFGVPALLKEHLEVHANNPLLFGEPQDVQIRKRSIDQVVEEETFSNSPSPTPKKSKQDTTIVCVQNSRSRDRKPGVTKPPQTFNKRCPMCGILFHSKASLVDHLAKRHPEQLKKTNVNIDLLPDAEEVPTITTTTVPINEGIMDENSLVQSMLSFGMLPSSDNPMDLLKKLSEGAGSAPLDLSQTFKMQSTGGSSGPLTDGSGGGVSSDASLHSDNDDSQSTFSHDSPSPQLHIQTSPNAVIINSPGLRGRFRPGSSKRYRTHLTPMQVQIMKHTFHHYKTPSMAECELIGGEMGLHKRVVQVWFQNARAKERKARVAVGQDPQTMSPTGPQTQCSICNVTYGPKVTMHDHLFGADHISALRDFLKLQGTEDVCSGFGSTNSSDYGGQDRSTNSVSKPSPAPVPEIKTTPSASSVDAALAQQLLNPYLNPAAYMMYSAGGFGGLPLAGLPLYDPSLHGTPVTMLQIPPTVMQTITAKLQSGSHVQCKFTQDGKSTSDLTNALHEKDNKCLHLSDVEVGWACQKCTTVFQSEVLFQNHQRVVCQSTDPVFKLLQIHYQCKACDVKFGTQAEYISHCEKSEHLEKRERLV